MSADIVPISGEVLPDPDASFEALTAGWTDKQKLVVGYYVQTLHKTFAGELAGFTGCRATIVNDVNAILAQPHIRQVVDVLLRQRAMSEPSVLAQLERVVLDYDRLNECVIDGRLDLDLIAQLGLMHLVRSVTTGRYGTTVKLADREAALQLLARARGMLKEQVTLSLEGLSDSELKQLGDAGSA